MQLILHNPADTPIGLQPTAYISGNSLSSVVLSNTIIRTSPKIKQWAPELRNCYFQHEKQLKFFKVYTQHNCEVECRANHTLSQCGCTAYYQPSKNNYSAGLTNLLGTY